MSQPAITLYDVPSRVAQPWVPSIWRIRLILNYKRLPHRTITVDFSELDTVMHSIGAPPTSYRSDGRPVYALPVIVDPARSSSRVPTVLSDVNHIVEYLETTYPARPIFPDGSRALQTLFVHYVQNVLSKPLLPILVPASHERLSDRSQTHFRSGPSSSAVPSANQLAGSQRERAWSAVKEQFDFLAAILDKNSGSDGNGVVVMGHSVTYADFALCSVLIWIQQVTPQDGWMRVKSWNGGRWEILLERCREYMDVL